MTDWIDCDISLPEQKLHGTGKYSQIVIVELSDGTISKDWLINDKWTVHCKKNGGAYPVRWKHGI